MDATTAIRERAPGRYALPGYERAPMGNHLLSAVRVAVAGLDLTATRLDLEEVRHGSGFRLLVTEGRASEAGLSMVVGGLLSIPPYGLTHPQLTALRAWVMREKRQRNPIRNVERRPGVGLVFLPGPNLIETATDLAASMSLTAAYVGPLAQLIDAYRGTSDRTLVHNVQAEGGAR